MTTDLTYAQLLELDAAYKMASNHRVAAGTFNRAMSLLRAKHDECERYREALERISLSPDCLVTDDAGLVYGANGFAIKTLTPKRTEDL